VSRGRDNCVIPGGTPGGQVQSQLMSKCLHPGFSQSPCQLALVPYKGEVTLVRPSRCFDSAISVRATFNLICSAGFPRSRQGQKTTPRTPSNMRICENQMSKKLTFPVKRIYYCRQTFSIAAFIMRTIRAKSDHSYSP